MAPNRREDIRLALWPIQPNESMLCRYAHKVPTPARFHIYRLGRHAGRVLEKPRLVSMTDGGGYQTQEFLTQLQAIRHCIGTDIANSTGD